MLSGEFIRAVADRIELNYSSFEGPKAMTKGLRRAGDALVSGLEQVHNHDLGGFFADFSPAKHASSSYVDLTI